MSGLIYALLHIQLFLLQRIFLGQSRQMVCTMKPGIIRNYNSHTFGNPGITCPTITIEEKMEEIRSPVGGAWDETMGHCTVFEGMHMNSSLHEGQTRWNAYFHHPPLTGGCL